MQAGKRGGSAGFLKLHVNVYVGGWAGGHGVLPFKGRGMAGALR